MANNTDPVRAHKPCGGCGNADPEKVCVGCLHDFGGTLASAPPSAPARWVFLFVDDDSVPIVTECHDRSALEKAVIDWLGYDAESDCGERMAPSIVEALLETGEFICEDGACYVLPLSAPPSAPVGVDDALVAGAMEAAADACTRHAVCNEAIRAALEYALAQERRNG